MIRELFFADPEMFRECCWSLTRRGAIGPVLLDSKRNFTEVHILVDDKQQAVTKCPYMYRPCFYFPRYLIIQTERPMDKVPELYVLIPTIDRGS